MSLIFLNVGSLPQWPLPSWAFCRILEHIFRLSMTWRSGLSPFLLHSTPSNKRNLLALLLRFTPPCFSSCIFPLLSYFLSSPQYFSSSYSSICSQQITH